MNFLQSIKEAQSKRRLLSETQLLMAKAYRGVAYSATAKSNQVANYNLMYRGLPYKCLR